MLTEAENRGRTSPPLPQAVHELADVGLRAPDLGRWQSRHVGAVTGQQIGTSRPQERTGAGVRAVHARGPELAVGPELRLDDRAPFLDELSGLGPGRDLGPVLLHGGRRLEVDL